MKEGREISDGDPTGFDARPERSRPDEGGRNAATFHPSPGGRLTVEIARKNDTLVRGCPRKRRRGRHFPKDLVSPVFRSVRSERTDVARLRDAEIDTETSAREAFAPSKSELPDI